MCRALFIAVLLTGCGRGEIPTPPAAPADHTPSFVRDHDDRGDCAECHGDDSCMRCHRSRPPADHMPGYSGLAHGVDARMNPDRCSTCHTGPICAGCHSM